MGNTQGKIPQAHVRMYENLLAIQSPGVRAQMIQTMISSPDHMNSMRVMGIYGHLLHYNQVIQAGGAAPPLPYERGSGARSAAATGQAATGQGAHGGR